MEREISIMLKVKGAEAAKKAVQDIFSTQTTTLVTKTNEKLKETGDVVERVGRKAKQAKPAVFDFTKSLGRAMAQIYLYQRAYTMFGEKFEQGMQLERAASVFQQKVGDVNSMLPILRSATSGVVSDLELLKDANRAVQQGLNPANLAKSFKMATVAAQRLGLNTSDALDTITNALTRQDEGALNTLGIITTVNQAYKTQSALIAKNGGVMSNAMSIQLRQSLIMKELEARFGGTNRAQNDGLQIIERLRASFTNFRLELGKTLSFGLRPLLEAFTALTDVATNTLRSLNNTEGFKKFTQVAITLVTALGTMKAVSGLNSLIGMFGLLGNGGGLLGAGKASKMFSSLSRVIQSLGNVVLKMLPSFRGLLLGLSMGTPAMARFFAMIPGWGTAIAGLLVFFDPVTTAIGNMYTAAKVLFQLLTNFDKSTGMSKVLRKDKEELGYLYNMIETVAKGALYVGAVFRGMGEGISTMIAPASSALSWISDKVDYLSEKLLGIRPSALVASQGLESVAFWAKEITRFVGMAASVVAMFIPGLQAVGAIGAATIGASYIQDIAGMVSGNTGSQPAGNQQPTQGRTQTSTQMTSPEPRAQNIDFSVDLTEILRENNKLLKAQNQMMETDSLEGKLKDSQNKSRQSAMDLRI